MILQYLQDNHEALKELTLPLTLQRLELLKDCPLFQEEIDKEYLSKVQSIITIEVTGRLGVSTEEVLVVLEDIDLWGYLR